MVTKCKECGQYRMRVNENGICNICLASKDRDDLSVVVQNLEKEFEHLSREFKKLELKVERQYTTIETIKKYAREMRNGKQWNACKNSP